MVCALLVASCALSVLAFAQEAPRDPLKALAFRNIGPATMGGRVDDVAVVESNPQTFYVATAAGGIWKTVNSGTTFVPVFDDHEVSTIGDITLAPSDPQTLYAGSGEPNNRQSSSWGNGVYRTRDGGKTWAHVGLSGTQAIGRIVVHPANPDVAYVAALGPLWGPGGERGLFKTTDGGRSWTNTKSIDADTGFVDVAMDPQSPDTLYAASYQRRRQPFGYSGGGPGSALWKTTDGGATWKKLTQGLPEGERGRTGIAIYRRDPKIVYVTIEHAKEGGVYRSADAGESFTKVERHEPAAVLLQQDPRGPEQRPPPLGAGRAHVLLRGRRQDLEDRPHPEDPRRLPRSLDRPRELRPHVRGFGRRHAPHLGRRPNHGLPQHRAPRPVLRGERGLGHALSGVRRAAGQRELVRPQPHPRPAGHLERGLVPGGRGRRLLHRRGSRRSRHRLRGEPGRQRAALRPPHEPDPDHPSPRPRGRALPLQLELAHPRLAPRPPDRLLRGQPALRLEGPGRDLDPRDPRPHERAEAGRASHLRQEGEGVPLAQRRGRALGHHHHRRGVAAARGNPLGGDGRRQRAGLARRGKPPGPT